MHPSRSRLSVNYLFFLCFAFVSAGSFAQTPKASVQQQKPVFADPRTGKKVDLKQVPRSQADTTGRDSVVQFIVRLRTSPGARSAAGRAAQGSKINQEHQEFLANLNALTSNARTSGETRVIKVVHEYKRSFNGFTLKGNKSFHEAIKKMPHVISVTEDRKVQANDATSNNVIKAPQVWNEVGATGEGVVIAIIDTGIDYDHPDLGGGIGPGNKVIGGYDFINNDSDPHDDHGHGTHVAGIAAANGELKGVAPDAQLMAIKVLDQYGNGWDSQILAGIEYAMDPDGNPNTDDAPDVANMSLGRAPDPLEPMSEAVNNAVLQGICFVIAAGNSYDYFRVGTPGIAEEAITVAATDNYGFTAYFSSKGPVQETLFLKPDIAAPGVAINSTFLDSGYESLDGTSMASPHVAGVAALMLDKHPDWTPQEIKGAMMSTASTDGYGRVLEVGAGIVDAYKAIKTNIVMTPGSISYGQPKTSESTWTRQDVITVSNKGTSSAQVQLSIEGVNIESAIDIQISPSEFTLAAGASREVIVDIEVDMASLGRRNIPDGYFGAIKLTSGDQTLKTLLTLFNPSVTTLSFDVMPSHLIIAGLDNGYWELVTPPSTSFDLMLPAGRYDILTWFEGYNLVVTEDYSASSTSSSLEINSTMASNRVDFKPVDIDGNPIPFVTWDNTILGTSAMVGRTTITMWSYPVETFYVSDTQHYKFFLRIFNVPLNPENLYEISLSSGSEISESKVITNDPNDFTLMTVTNPATTGDTQNFHFHLQAPVFGTSNTYPVQIPNPATIYSYEDQYDETSSYYRFLPAAGQGGFAWETTMRGMTPEGQMAFYDFYYWNWVYPLVTLPEGPFDFQLGHSLLNFTAEMQNNSEFLELWERGPRGAYNHTYGERLSGAVNWSLKSGGQVLSSGSFQNSVYDDYLGMRFFQKPITSGSYTLSLKWDSYYVGGRFGTVTTDLDFSTDNFGDYSPPSIASFTLTSDNRSTNALEAGKGGMVSVKINEWYPYNTTLQMKKFSDEHWTSMVVDDSMDGSKVAEIRDDIPAGFYSLRLISEDESGNKITHTLEPAFVVGDHEATVPFTKVTLITPLNRDVNAGVDPMFTWSPITDAEYVFQLSKSEGFEELVADVNVAQTFYSLPESLDEDQVYYWRVQATVNGSQLPVSNPFIFKSSKLKAATLISPANDATNVEVTPTDFLWTPVNQQDWQYLEVSLTEDFSQVIYYLSLQPGTSQAEIWGLWNNAKFYWRIKTPYFDFFNQYDNPSETFTFHTGDGDVDPPGTDPPDEPGGPGDDDDPKPDLTTGLEDSNSLSSFPNPFTDRTYIRLVSKASDVAQISLLDQLGRPVRTSQHTLAKGENIIPIEAESGAGSLTQGMYIALIKTGSQQTFRVKLVKR